MKKLTKTKMLCSMLIGAGLLVSAGAVATNTVSANTAVDVNAFEMTAGASVRLATPYGIRFRVKIGQEVHADIMTNEANVQKKVGMFIVPAAYVENAAAYTDGVVGNYQNFKQKNEVVFYDSGDAETQNKIYDGNDGYYYANGVIANLKFQNYGMEFMGIAYVAETDTTTSTTTYEFADFNLDDTARTSTYVASAAYAETSSSKRDVLTDYVYGAYLYAQKGVTYDETLKVYNVGETEYATINAAVEGLGCNFALSLSDETATMTAMQEKTLTASLKDGATDTGLDLAYEWTTTDENVVKVENGKLFATGAGEATVTVSLLGQSKSCVVSVTDEREAQTLAAVDYDLSAGGDLTLAGLNGTAEKAYVKATNGTETVDLTASATISGSNVSIAEAAVKALKAGVWTFNVDTTATKATAEVTVANYVISNYTEFKTFHTKATDLATTVSWYVVLDDDIDASASNVDATMLGNGKYLRFGGVFDGRGHVIDGLKVNRYLFRYFDGVIKNVAFTNYGQYGTLHGENCSLVRESSVTAGLLSNVYIQAEVPDDCLVEFDDINVENVVINMTFTNANPAYVFCGVESGSNNLDAEKYAADDIYVIANSTVADGKVYLYQVSEKQEDASYTYANGPEVAYKNADALVADKNAEGKMFDSEAGWASYWKVEADGIYFGDVRVEKRTAQKLGAYDYDTIKGTNTAAFTVENIPADVTEAFLTKGTETVDVKDMISEKTLTVPGETMSALSWGIWSLTVKTATAAYEAEITVATYVISDYAEFKTFHTATTSASAGSASWYVVLDKSFDAPTNRTSDMLVNAYRSTTRRSFGGILDGRGHVINHLTLNRALFYQLDGTIKNIAFTDCAQQNTSNTNCSFIGHGSGTLSNVYLQETVKVYPLTEENTLKLDNVVVNVTTEADKVFTNLAASEYTQVAENVYTTNDIYVIANPSVAGSSLAFSDDSQAANTSKLIYANANALVADKNAEGKMFDSEAGWASYWKVEADGIYFNGVKVETLTQA